MSLSSKKLKKTLTVKEIRVEKFLKLIEKKLSDTQYLGKAIDNGDCFYDALSQTLKHIGIDVPPKQMRLDIAKALENSNTATMIEKNISNNFLGIDSFDNYKKYVRYTHEELANLKKMDSKAPDAPYWGSADREGVILCELYKFKIRVLSAGFLESIISNDKKYTTYSDNKSKFEEHEDKTVINTLIDERLVELYNNDSYYYTGDDSYPTGTLYTNTCTLALCENHFVPVLTKDS